MSARILVVDDDPNIQRLLTYTLKQEGYEVIVASDGAEGPKMDGYQVAAKVRADEGPGAHVPIIMLTAEADVEQKVRGLRAGADDYQIKPFHPPELLARTKSLLTRSAPGDLVVGKPPMGRVHAFCGAKGGLGTNLIAMNPPLDLHREIGRKVVLV